MKANLRLAGLSLIAAVVITLISTANAWPHTDHHRFHDTVRRVTPISSAHSGSSLIHHLSTENKTSFGISGHAPGTETVNTRGGLNHASSNTDPTYYPPSREIPLNDKPNKKFLTTAVHPAKTSTVKPIATSSGRAASSGAISGSPFIARALDLRSVAHSDNAFAGGYQSFVLTLPNQAPESTTSLAPTPTSTSATSSAPSSTPSSVCPAGNGTTYTSSAGKQYQVICAIDFPNNDYPFYLVASFDACVQQCDLVNTNAGSIKCFAALFVPSREGYANDCYLKSAISDPTPSTLDIEGAILMTGVQSSSSAHIPTTSAVSSLSSSALSSAVVSSSSAQSGNLVPAGKVSTVPAIAVTYASGSSVVIPTVAVSSPQGPTSNRPTEKYISWKPPADITLQANLLTKGVNGNLSTNYGLSLDTGILELNATTQLLLANITDTPHISRDGGKGGYLNGQHLFIFCDTGSYTTTSSSSEGNFLGFVSSSVAVDVGMNGLSGKALTLQDGIGQWTDNQGRMRGLSPMTQGEESYNLAMQGNGQRYAVWPESSIIPLDAESAIVYAPVVYDDVNMTTKKAVFTYTGNTLLTITAGGDGGPVAERTVNKIFDADEVEWGCVGGIRSWGVSGVGGTDGRLYLFGRVQGGLLLARTGYADVANRGLYEYWTGKAWSSSMQPSTSTAYFISGPFMDVDLFYSPRHLTFIIVYMTVYADSTFYYRYLKADGAILPPGAPGGNRSSDYVENLTKYQWSQETVLYKAPPGLGQTYAYSGGVHQGYYGADDITNGGTKMLLSWTAPTGQNPASLNSEYQIVTAEIDWD